MGGGGEKRCVAPHIWQTVNELVCKGFFARLLNEGPLLVFWRVFPFSSDETVLDVLQDCLVEQKRLLLHQANLRSPPLEVDFPQMTTTYLDLAIPEEECLEKSGSLEWTSTRWEL